MMNYYDFPDIYASVLLVLLFITLCFSVLCMAWAFRRQRVAVTGVLSVCFIVNMILLVNYGSNMRASIYEQTVPGWITDFSRMPLLVSVGMLIGIITVEGIVTAREYHFRKTAITHSSIKESLDHLNTGLCFSHHNGSVMLVNYVMMRLAFDITGEKIQNAAYFWNVLQNGNVNEEVNRLSAGDTPEFRLVDGTVWTFRREELEGAIQLTAADTTELHRLMDELRADNKNLEAMYQRICDYGDKVEQYVIAKERLETKENLHRFLGQSLLASRHYLQYGSGNVKQIFEMWQRNIDILKLEAELQPEMDSFDELKANASVVGVRVTISGTIPPESEINRLLALAGVEAVINAGKHADAKNLMIDVKETENEYVARYTNDGRLPSVKIAEGGGLSSLRAKVERLGGKMDVCSRNEFVLTITLRKE